MKNPPHPSPPAHAFPCLKLIIDHKSRDLHVDVEPQGRRGQGLPAPDDLSHVAVVVAAPLMELGIGIGANFKLSTIEQCDHFEGGTLSWSTMLG